MFYAIITACTLQGQCLIAEDVHGPFGDTQTCSQHLLEEKTGLESDMSRAIGMAFGPQKFKMEAFCLNELQYMGFLNDIGGDE